MAPIRILCIVDSDSDAHLLEQTLSDVTEYQFDVVREQRIAGALKYLDNNHVDVILLDISLPDFSCLDSITRLRTFAPGQAIVIVINSDDHPVALEAVKNGAQDYLIKSELNPVGAARVIRYAIERHKYDAQVAKLANFDRLTGLANRCRCMDYLEHALENARRLKKSLSVLFIDCDHFKLVNDTLGHNVGDDFLKKMGGVINQCLRASDFIARLGGDEFVVVLDQEDNTLRSSLVVAEKILKSVRQGIELDGGEWVNARCSIGIASYTGHEARPTADQLIREADTAMYSAKRKGGDRVCFFDSEMEKQAERRVSLLRGVTHAFRTGEFTINYQPIINTASGFYEGIEALLRWHRSNGQTVPPDEFIPLLEETGMIRVIGAWVMERACQDFKSLNDKGLLPDNAWISVNVSPVQFNDFNFADRVIETIFNVGINPGQLQLEITESLLLNHAGRAVDLIMELKEVGVLLAIDDFGTGYCSMKHLKELALDRLKIDETFVLQSAHTWSDRAVVRAIIALAHNLNMQVIAEGVETASVSQQLAHNQPNFLQGFYYAPPMPLDELRGFYRNVNGESFTVGLSS